MKEKKTYKPDGRCATCPKWDRWHIRLPTTEDQQKAIELYRKSGAKNKSDFVRARLLGEPFKVITQSKSSEKYLRELSQIISLTRKVGPLYNETVKTLNSYHSIATAQQMLHKLEKYSALLINLQLQAIKLTEEYSDMK